MKTLVAILLLVFICGISSFALMQMKNKESSAFGVTSASAPIRQANGVWCSDIPVGFSQATMPPYYVFFPSTAQLGDFGEHPYYIYFDGSYVGPEAANLDGSEPSNKQWRFRVPLVWASLHSNWRTVALWRVDYICSAKPQTR